MTVALSTLAPVNTCRCLFNTASLTRANTSESTASDRGLANFSPTRVKASASTADSTSAATASALFSTLLHWLLEHYRNQVIAAMIGLMLGSMRVLWPWPNGPFTTTLEAPSGDVVLPIVLAVGGAAVVIAVEHFSSRVGTMPESLD